MLKTEVEHLRALVFEMLSCLSYLRSIGRLPDDMTINFVRLEEDARAALEIKSEAKLPSATAAQHPPPPLQSQVEPPVDVFAPRYGSLVDAARCPKCGDETPKTVHLRRRPRGGLQCRACGHEYSFPSAWV